jgi:2-haloacid dehalogenase
MPTWRPEAILFDACETLFNPGPLRKPFEQAGLPGSALDIWLARVQGDGMAHAATGTFAAFEDLAEFHLRGVSRDYSADASAHVNAVLEAWRQLPPHPDVEPGLELIRDGQVRRATLTNEPSELTSAWLESGGLRSYFEGVIDASAVMAWKPRSQTYVHASDELGSAIERTALISAHPWDIHGATCAGLVGAWLNRTGAPYPAMMNPPQFQASTLAELADRLLELPRW